MRGAYIVQERSRAAQRGYDPITSIADTQLPRVPRYDSEAGAARRSDIASHNETSVWFAVDRMQHTH